MKIIEDRVRKLGNGYIMVLWNQEWNCFFFTYFYINQIVQKYREKKRELRMVLLVSKWHND